MYAIKFPKSGKYVALVGDTGFKQTTHTNATQFRTQPEAVVAARNLFLAGSVVVPWVEHPELTKLEQFVLANCARGFMALATETNRSLRSIEQAYDRANLKQSVNRRSIESEQREATDPFAGTCVATLPAPAPAAHPLTALDKAVGEAIEKHVETYRVCHRTMKGYDKGTPQHRAYQMQADKAHGALEVLADLFPKHPAFPATGWSGF